MNSPLRILHLEDNAQDADLIQATLEAEGIACQVTRLDTEDDFSAALEQGAFDLILADYTLPSFDGLSALKIALQKCPDIPFLFVSGSLGEELAIETLQIGATDYILKHRLSRLVPAVQRALRESQERAEHRRAQALLSEEKRLLEMIAKGSSFSEISNALCELVEKLSAGSLCSILLLRPHDNRLWHAAAPSLPKGYTDAIEGLVIGPAAGSCGTAVYRKEAVIVSDIAADPLWADFRDLALSHGLRASWSTPIFAPDGPVLGTFAVYYTEPRSPAASEENMMERIADLASIAIDRRRAEEERQAHVRFLEKMDRVTHAIQGTNNIEQMMSDVLDTVLATFNCDQAWLVYPCDPDAQSWQVPMERTTADFPGAFSLKHDLPVTREIAQVFDIVRSSSSPVRFGPGSTHPLPPETASRFSIQSIIGMALYPKGAKPYMFGLHQCSHPRVWTVQEEILFQEIGRQLESALTSVLIFRNLADSERKLEEAQRVARVGWWERDFATNRVSLSDEVCRAFGVEPVDLPQWQDRWLNLIHPEDRAKAAEATAAAVRGGPRYDIEYRVIRPDGTIRVVHSQGDVTWDESGRALRQFGVLQDITELWQAQNELRISEARFRTFVDHATDAFFLHDEELNVIDVNRQACESLGYSREELIGMHPRDFDAGMDEASLARFAERVGAGETVTFETLHRRKDGSVFPVEIRARQFQQGDQLWRLSLVRDISERKWAEQRVLAEHAVAQVLANAETIEEATPKILEAICECLGWNVGALWRVDRDAGVLRCVACYHKQSVEGSEFESVSWAITFPPGTGLPGHIWSRREPIYIPDATRDPMVVRGPIAACEGLRAAFGFPILLGGEVLGVIDFFSREIREPDQELLSMVATIGSEIGQFIERKRAEQALAGIQSELAHVSRVAILGEMSASIAHEINQPLGAIVNNAGACLRWLAANNFEEARHSAELIRADGQRAGEIIQRIRSLAKKAPPQKDWMDINQTIRDVIALVRTELQRREVMLEMQLADAFDSVIFADRIQLQQVILNLVINAVEAMSELSEGRRQLLIRTGTDGTREIVVSVRDSGPGLSPETIDRLFTPFYTTKPQGMGMGLAICRSIVEAHGGRLWATANEDRGATFQFTLPTSVDQSTRVA